MRERMEKTSRIDDREAIRRDLADAGIRSPEEWREALEIGDGGPFGKPETRVHPEESQRKERVGIIDDAAWQKEMDRLFLREGLAFVHLLKRVRPDSSPSPEVVRKRLHTLILSRPVGWRRDYSDIVRITNIDADPDVLEAECRKLFKEKPGLEWLEDFFGTTKFVPPVMLVQEFYAEMIKGESSFAEEDRKRLRALKKWTHIEPDVSLLQDAIDGGRAGMAKTQADFLEVPLTDEMIQQAYARQVERGGSLSHEMLSAVRPNAEIVQRAYELILAGHGRDSYWADRMKMLRRATGIKPAFTEEQLRPLYEKVFQDQYLEIEAVESVMEMTNSKPPSDLVKKGMLADIRRSVSYFTGDDVARVRASADEWQTGLGVSVAMDGADIQALYDGIIRKSDGNRSRAILTLFGAFGVRPAVDLETARQFMLSLVHNETSLGSVTALEDAFGVKCAITAEERDELFDKCLKGFWTGGGMAESAARYYLERLHAMETWVDGSCPPEKILAA